MNDYVFAPSRDWLTLARDVQVGDRVADPELFGEGGWGTVYGKWDEDHDGGFIHLWFGPKHGERIYNRSYLLDADQKV